jgi:hypothetical protein
MHMHMHMHMHRSLHAHLLSRTHVLTYLLHEVEAGGATNFPRAGKLEQPNPKPEP